MKSDLWSCVVMQTVISHLIQLAAARLQETNSSVTRFHHCQCEQRDLVFFSLSLPYVIWTFVVPIPSLIKHSVKIRHDPFTKSTVKAQTAISILMFVLAHVRSHYLAL